MHPCLTDGSRVLVEPAAMYLPGDILVFETYFGEILSHRLIGLYLRRKKLYYLTQADNAPNADRGIEKNKILGKVRVDVPLMTRLRSFARFIKYTGKWVVRHGVR